MSLLAGKTIAVLGGTGPQGRGLARRFNHLRFQGDGRQINQTIKLGPVERLRNDQPADKVGGLNRRRGCQRQPAVCPDDAALAAFVQPRPQRIRGWHAAGISG